MLVPLQLLNLLAPSGAVPLPIILQQPANQTVQAGQAASFSIVATGASLTYQWFQNGLPIPGATSSFYSTGPTVFPGNNGNTFFCIVSNAGGSVTSSSATLVVLSVTTTPAGIGAVSGTISQTIFNTNKLIDHIYRRCKVPAKKVAGEMVEIAQRLLYLRLSELASKGIPLWAIDKQVLPLYQGSSIIQCPTGTVDVLNLNLRDLQYLSGTPTASQGVAANAFDMNPQTACTQTTAAGFINLALASTTNITSFGILPNVTAAWNIAVLTSNNGVLYNAIYSNTSFSAVAGQWQWFDIEQILSANQSQFSNGIVNIQLQALGSTILDVQEFAIGNLPKEIPMSKINRDDYRNLPDQTFQGRPVQYWYDKQRSQPLLRIWPAADAPSLFRQLVMTRHRYIMDVGTLPQVIEVPQRWFNAIIDLAAVSVGRETPNVTPATMAELQAFSVVSLKEAWDSESDGSPTYLRPAISCYTR